MESSRSGVVVELLRSYVLGNPLFVVLHAMLLTWAALVFLRGRRAVDRDRVWLHNGNTAGTGHLASLWNRLRNAGNAGRVELRDLYETQASVDSDDLARIANLLLLLGVTGTLWNLFGVNAAQVKPAEGSDAVPVDMLKQALGSFSAFSVTIASVGLAFVVLVFQRVLGRSVASVAFEAAKAWEGPGAAIGGDSGELRVAIQDLTRTVAALGPQGGGEWARAEVDRIAAELGACAQAASQQMTGAAGSFAAAFTKAVAPLTAQITDTIRPVVDRINEVTTALESSTRSLESQRQVLEQHAAALEVIHGRLGTAELAVQHLRDVPAVVASSLLDIGKHVGGTLTTLHANFVEKLEGIFKIHENAVLTVARRIEDTESQLASAVESGTAEVKQYLVHHGHNLTATVDGMLANAARAADASIWAPVRRSVEDIASLAQRASANVTAAEGAAVEAVRKSVVQLGDRARAAQGDIAVLEQHATAGVSTVKGTAVAAMESVQQSVARLGDRARAVAQRLDEMREAIGVPDASRPSGWRSVTMAHWVSTGVLTAAMVVLCALFYTRLGR